MRVTLIHQGKERTVDVANHITVSTLLEQAGINPETVIVRKNEEIVPDTENVEDGDTIEALRIISGG